MTDGTVQISTSTGNDFAGEQFLLWWDRSNTQGGGIQGLAFFLNPIYETPAGNNGQVFHAAVNSSDISTSPSINTLVFEGFVAVGGKGDQVLASGSGCSNSLPETTASRFAKPIGEFAFGFRV